MDSYEKKTDASRTPFKRARLLRVFFASVLGVFLASVLGLLLLSPRLARAGDPSLKWRTIKTKNFYIHYYEKERAVARRVAVLTEQVHKMLVPLMKWKPRRRTHVVLTDDTDSANGLAQVVPRSVVRLYVTAPEDMETLNDFDDWLFFLFTHEYTHILHLNTRGGLADVINAIFGLGRGILYAPNHVQPRWFIEGVAVLNETVRTTGGRIRSSLYKMILRSAVLEKKTISLSELSSTVVRYPHGRAQYLYGAFFMHYLYQRFGWRALVGISHDYGRQTVPFGLNKIAKRHLGGKGYLTLYKEWRRRLRRKFASKVRLIKRRGLRRGRPLTRTGETTAYPVYHPSGRKVVFLESDGHHERSLKLISPTGGKKHPITRVETGAASTFSPDGRFLVFSQLDVHKSVYSYSDLYRWDMKKKKLTRLTKGLRAREPHIAPHGRTVAFTLNRLGRMCLATMPFQRTTTVTPKKRRDVKILWCPKKFEQVYTPSWSPDGRYIAFSAWLRGGYRDLFVYDTKTQHLQRLTRDRALDTNPRYSPDGRWIYFSSDRTGVYNIYAYELATKRLRQVTNVITGAFHPAISPSGRRLVYVGFTAKGYDLYTMKLNPKGFLTAPPSLPTRPKAKTPALLGSRRPLGYSGYSGSGLGREPRYAQANPASHSGKRTSKREHAASSSDSAAPPTSKPTHKSPLDPDRVILSDKPYNPLWTLAPETWWMSYEGPGIQSLSLLLNGSDVVGHHTWTLSTNYWFDSNRLNLGMAYNYNRLWPGIHVGLSYNDYERNDWSVGDDTRSFRAYDMALNVGLDLPVLRSYRWGFGSLALRYRFSKWDCRECLNPATSPTEPMPQAPIFGKLSGVSLGLYYSKTRAWTYSVSPEKGRSLGLSLSVYSPQIGADYEAASLTWRWTEYIPMPWLKHHVLTLRYAGGIGWGHPRYRSLYSIGGFADQDMVQALIDQTMVIGASLRGYDPSVAVGDHYHLLNMEYRFPICWLNWAPWTIPLFFRRLWGTVFVDGGHAFFGELKKDTYKDLRWGVGGELLMDLYMGYYEGLTLRLGYAYGLNDGGGHRYYFFFGIPLG